MALNIRIEKRSELLPKPDWKNLGFGKYLTDHMFLMDHDENGWHDARIVPTGPISLPPDAMILHYSQETFEGLKAYRRPDGGIQLFRPERNGMRFEEANFRMDMPFFSCDDFVESIRALISVDCDWVPSEPGASLYIRPFMFAKQGMLAMHACTDFTYCVLLSPVGAYFAAGFKPVRIMVEDEYVRAVRGGTGAIKCGGNYGGALLAAKLAEAKGFSQVLWLDGVHKKYVEEAGGMNFIYFLDGALWTAPLAGSVLPGVTRDSILTLAREWGLTVHEEYMDVDTLFDHIRSGRVTEAFACGTAAVVSPIGSLAYKGEELEINHFRVGPYTEKFYKTLTDIQWGRVPDSHNWILPVC